MKRLSFILILTFAVSAFAQKAAFKVDTLKVNGKILNKAHIDSTSEILNKTSGGKFLSTALGDTSIPTRALKSNSIDSTKIAPLSVGISELQANTFRRAATLIVAATDSKYPLAADYSGGINAINSAISALPDSGGKIILLDGTYTGAVGVYLNKQNLTIEGQGKSTKIDRNGDGVNDIYTDSAIKNILLKDISYNQTNFASGTTYKLINVFIAGTFTSNLDASKTNKLAASTRGATLVIAASNSSTNAKNAADYVCDGTADQSEINAAISALPDSGGNVTLLEGQYNVSSQIAWTKKNVTLSGQGMGTYLNYTGGGSCISVATRNTFVKDLRSSGAVAVSGGENSKRINIIHYATTYIDDSVSDYSIGSTHLNASAYRRYGTIVVSNSGSKYPQAADYTGGISSINTAISALPDSGGTIILADGSFTGTSGVYVNKHNVIIRGQGRNTKIDRDGSGVNDIYTDSAIRSLILENLSYNQAAFASGTVYKLINVWLAGTFISRNDLTYKNVIEVGNSAYCDYSSLKAAYDAISDNSATNRYLIVVYDKITETLQTNFNEKYIDVEGKNAEIVFNSNTSITGFLFSSTCKGTFRNITFKSTGTSSNLSNQAVANVLSDSCEFDHCEFSNMHITTAAISGDGSTVNSGDRLHGIVISGSSKFYYLKGSGSPYGHHNTRGIYIESTPTYPNVSPYLYHPLGIGQGDGNMSHGILVHTAGRPVLISPIGKSYATGFECSGIKFQGVDNAIVENPVGYAGDYSKWGAGIFVSYNSSPTIINAIGYTSENDSTYGLYIDEKAFPRINGGYFGPKEIQIDKTLSGSGTHFIVVSQTAAPLFVRSMIYWRNVSHPGVTMNIGTTYEGAEIANDVTLEGSSWAHIDYSEAEIAALDTLFFTTSGAITASDVTMNIIAYVNNPNSHALQMLSGEKAVIENAHFYITPAADCAEFDDIAIDSAKFTIDRCTFVCEDTTKDVLTATSSFSNVPIYYSRLEGQLNNITSFDTLQVILGSSNYKK
jgi:hypothetical protein